MADLLVKLYTLPDVAPLLASLAQCGIEIRQAHPAEKGFLAEWIRERFPGPWAAESLVALGQRPVTCYLAVRRNATPEPGGPPWAPPSETLLGFSCHDVTRKGMFGPMAVREDWRGLGIGKALLVTSLRAMAAEGYGYAVIGWAGPVNFYAKAVGATVIPDSEPGVFRGPLVAEG